MTHPRDGVDGLDGEPTIVSVGDVHGYLGRARSALRAVGDHSAFDPLVETEDDGHLHWAGNNYVRLQRRPGGPWPGLAGRP